MTNPGVVCLQGGRELTPACRAMDRAVLERCTGRVAVLAGAARPGRDYDGASARTVEHYRALGVAVDVVTDPRSDADRALAELADGIGLVVLPGGAPGGLLDVLTTVDGGSIGRRLTELWSGGVGLSGASAGAMVLCSRTVRPDRAGTVAAGLGLVDGIAVPHWSPGAERRWPLEDRLVWGLPECGGVLVDGDEMVALGEGRPSFRLDGSWHEVRRTPERLPA